MNEHPFFSIIMPSYNVEGYIEESIDSVLTQSLDDFELIIIDDGSTDKTVDIIKKIKAKDSRIILICQENSGKPSVVRNVGLKISRGRYISFLDSDDLYESTRLQKIYDVFTADPGILIVTHDLGRFDLNPSSFSPHQQERFNLLRSSPRFTRENNYYLSSEMHLFCAAHGQADFTNTISFSTQLLTKEKVWYDENLLMGEDSDFWFRLIDGNKTVFIDSILSLYRNRQGSLVNEEGLAADRYIVDEKIMIYETHYKKFDQGEKTSFLNNAYNDCLDLAYVYRQKGKKKLALKAYLDAAIFKKKIELLFLILKLMLWRKKTMIITWNDNGFFNISLLLVLLLTSCGNGNDSPIQPSQPVAEGEPYVERGGQFFNIQEKFNRVYTDPDFTPLRKIYVSINGSNTDLSNSTISTPSNPQYALANMEAGDQIIFNHLDTYNGCYNINASNSGTYDLPISILGGENEQVTTINCCSTGRASCFNLENANYISIENFILDGGSYGVRSVGAGYSQNQHQRGIYLNNITAHDSYKDPVFTGQSDWFVLENTVTYNAGSGDGHGIYLSNGGDFNIVRYNETYNNASSDFQVNADPISTCSDVGISYSDIRCHGSVVDGYGQGVSEYFVVEKNFFHNGLAQGPNFTSVRNSVINHNIVAIYARHNTSFWQESSPSEPLLGSSNNLVTNNFFLSNNNRHTVQFINNSVNSTFTDNIVLGMDFNSGISINKAATIIDAENNSEAFSIVSGNYFSNGRFEGMTPDSSTNEILTSFDRAWMPNLTSSNDLTLDSFVIGNTAPFNNWAPPKF